MPRFNNHFRGGQPKALTGSRVAMPSSIKCFDCGKVKEASNYSTKELDALTAQMRRDGKFNAATDGFSTCIICTPKNQVDERECSLCGITKARSAFNKAQFKMREDAICENCSPYQQGGNSDQKNSDSDDDDSGGQCSDDDDDDCGTSAVRSTFSNLGISNTYNTTQSSGGVDIGSQGGLTGTAAVTSTITDASWSTVSAKQASSSKTPSLATANISSLPPRNGGFNKNAYGTPSSQSGRSGGFAKVPAYKPEPGKKTSSKANQELDEVTVASDGDWSD